MPQAANGRGQYSKKYINRELDKQPKGMTDEQWLAYLEKGEKMFFYDSVCQKCNTGIFEEGERGSLGTGHSEEECKEFMRIRTASKIPLKVVLNQEEMREVIKYEKKHGKLPEATNTYPPEVYK